MAEVRTAGIIGFGSAGRKHYDAYQDAGVDPIYYDPHDGDTVPLDEVLACDVVSICSPDDTHMQYLFKALDTRSAKGVFVEKPITHKAEDLDLLRRELTETAAVIECHLPLRYHPPFVKALGEVRAGVLGKIVSIDMAYHYGRPKKISEGWRGRIPNYSLIVGGGIHLVDLACQIAGSYLRGVGGAVVYNIMTHDTRSVFAIIGEGPQGVMCTLATTCHEHVPHMHEMRVIGTAGVREIQNTVEVDHSIGVRLFLDKVRNGQRGNIAEAIAANRICIQLAEALR
jgi:predicted dehydrogenase